MGIDHSSFSAWLRRAIEDRLMTITSFADEAGVARETVHAWLAGTRHPRGVNIVRISRTLRVSRDEVDQQLGIAA